VAPCGTLRFRAGVLGDIVRNAKLFLVGVVAWAIAFVGTYLFLGTIWTHVFVKPENVTATDFYLVVALSAISGAAVASIAVRLLARRVWVAHSHAAHA
jgi:hypothetical protein